MAWVLTTSMSVEVSGLDGVCRLVFKSPISVIFRYLEVKANRFLNSSYGEREKEQSGVCTLLQS